MIEALEIALAVGQLSLLFVVPIGVYLLAKRLLSDRRSRFLINVLSRCGIGLALVIMAYPLFVPITDSGGIGIILLVPLGGLLGITCAILMWYNNRAT